MKKQTHEQKLALAKKYFIEQKKEEITSFVKTVLLYVTGATPVVVIPYLVGRYFTDRTSQFCGTINGIQPCGIVGQWFLGIEYILFPLMLIAVIGTSMILIGVSIYDWLNGNWTRAKKRAGLK